MSISGYSSSLSIPPYPGPTPRVSDVKPVQRDTEGDDPQRSTTTPVANTTSGSNGGIPSTGLLNTVV